MMTVKWLTDGSFPNGILVLPEVFLSSYFKLLTPSHSFYPFLHGQGKKGTAGRKKKRKNRIRVVRLVGSSASYGGVVRVSHGRFAGCGALAFPVSRPDRGKRWQQRRQWMNHSCHVGPVLFSEPGITGGEGEWFSLDDAKRGEARSCYSSRLDELDDGSFPIGRWTAHRKGCENEESHRLPISQLVSSN